MLTLLCVTFPVELIFLGVLRALGWLHFSILFVLFSILFFCIAVCLHNNCVLELGFSDKNTIL